VLWFFLGAPSWFRFFPTFSNRSTTGKFLSFLEIANHKSQIIIRWSYQANQAFHQGPDILPGSLGRLDIRPGDSLHAAIEEDRIVLTPPKKRANRAKFVTDLVIGLPALSAGPTAPTQSGNELQEILANFP
jgi:hypothetical protein